MEENDDALMLGGVAIDTTMIGTHPIPDYPSDKFAGKRKPPIVWSNSEDPKQCREVVYAGLKAAGGLTIESVIAFLCDFADTCKKQLDADWKSYNVTIGKKGDAITIRDLFEIQKEKENVKVTGTTDVKLTSDADLWIAHAIFAIWRIVRIGKQAEGNYRTELIERAQRDQWELFRNDKTNNKGKDDTHAPDISSCADSFINWGYDTTLSSLAAGFDMFFYRFSNDTNARVRFGTIITRYRDCAALMGIGFIAKTLGMETHRDLYEWVYVRMIAKDILRIAKKGQEYDDLMGYFPYYVEMWKIRKSPYSSSINPNVHMFLNIIGGLKGRKRCLRAQVYEETPLSDIVSNAECVVYATRQLSTFTRGQKKSSLFLNNQPIDDPTSSSNGIPMTKNGDEFYLWLHGNGFKMPEEITKYCKECASIITETRAGKTHP